MTGLQANRITVVAGDRMIVDSVDCTVPSGTLAALIGPNGAGKSTLLRALAAVHPPRFGEVAFEDADLLRMPRRARARLAALVEQDATTETAMTVAQVVGLGRIPHESVLQAESAESARIVAAALETVDMTAFAHRLYVSLSGGERQRVMLARALAQEPRLLLLDEPTNHLDVHAQLAALELLRGLTETGRTVLAALHDLNLAATYADHVIVLSGGRVVAAGPTAETLRPTLIREVYRVDATVLEHPVTGRPVIAFSPLRPAPSTPPTPPPPIP